MRKVIRCHGHPFVGNSFQALCSIELETHTEIGRLTDAMGN